MPPIQQKNFFDSDSEEEEDREREANTSIRGNQTESYEEESNNNNSRINQERQSSINNNESNSGRDSSIFNNRFNESIRDGRDIGMDLDFDESSRGGGGRGREESLNLDDILGTGTNNELEGVETNAKKMLRALSNEMSSPELLHFPKDLVERFVKDLATRVSFFCLLFFLFTCFSFNTSHRMLTSFCDYSESTSTRKINSRR